MEKKILNLIAKFRVKYPKMFSHPDLDAGEVFLGALPLDIADMTISAYHAKGAKSARRSENFFVGYYSINNIPTEMDLYNIFISVYELAIIHLNRKKWWQFWK